MMAIGDAKLRLACRGWLQMMMHAASNSKAKRAFRTSWLGLTRPDEVNQWPRLLTRALQERRRSGEQLVTRRKADAPVYEHCAVGVLPRPMLLQC